jgi:hypothetical protein
MQMPVLEWIKERCEKNVRLNSPRRSRDLKPLQFDAQFERCPQRENLPKELGEGAPSALMSLVCEKGPLHAGDLQAASIINSLAESIIRDVAHEPAATLDAAFATF